MRYQLNKIICLFCASILAYNAQAHSRLIEPEYVDQLVEAYLQVTHAFAKDDLVLAKTNAELLMKIIHDGPDFKKANSLAKLDKHTKKIIEETKIEYARRGFSELSNEMKLMIEHVGTGYVRDIYLIFCPMAFGGKGAFWMQENKDVANPFHGQSMPKCGRIVDQLVNMKHKNSAKGKEKRHRE